LQSGAHCWFQGPGGKSDSGFKQQVLLGKNAEIEFGFKRGDRRDNRIGCRELMGGPTGVSSTAPLGGWQRE